MFELGCSYPVMELGVSLGMVFTETDQINPSKNGFGNSYMNTENRNTETEYTKFFLFGSGITPLKTENTELPYRNGKIPKLPKTNTESTNFKMSESKYTKITKINYTFFIQLIIPIFILDVLIVSPIFLIKLLK